MWAWVKEETEKGKQKWRMGDSLADDRRSPTVLDFLRSTLVGRTTPPAGKSGQRGRSGGGGNGRRGGASGVVTRGRLVSVLVVSFRSLGAGSVFLFLTLYFLGALSVS